MKTEREIAAIVIDEWFFAREEVEEPLIKGVTEVAVFVPMRSEAGEVMNPVCGNADGLPIEIRAGCGIECPG